MPHPIESTLLDIPPGIVDGETGEVLTPCEVCGKLYPHHDTTAHGLRPEIDRLRAELARLVPPEPSIPSRKLIRLDDVIAWLEKARAIGSGRTCIWIDGMAWGAAALWRDTYAQADEVEDLATRPTYAGPVEWTHADWRSAGNIAEPHR